MQFGKGAHLCLFLLDSWEMLPLPHEDADQQ